MRGAWLAVGLLGVVALWTLKQSVDAISFHRRQMESRQVELQEMRELRATMGAQHSEFARMRQASTPDQRLSAVIKRHFSGIETDLALRESRAAGEGWNEQRYDMRIESAEPDRLSAFLAACENAEPPIRLLEIQVSAPADPRGGLTAQLALAELVPPAE